MRLAAPLLTQATIGVQAPEQAEGGEEQHYDPRKEKDGKKGGVPDPPGAT